MNLFVIFGILAILIGGLLIPNRAWALPRKANPYAADIQAAERTNSLPVNLLGRVLWQESRFRQDIITGETKSSAGAVGIAQIIPRFHPSIDPTNPIESIYYAAGLLADHKQRFGTWPLALAAYNRGPTATRDTLREWGTEWFAHIGPETRNYVNDIIDDIPSAA